jgi:hypothetical protein
MVNPLTKKFLDLFLSGLVRGVRDRIFKPNVQEERLIEILRGNRG